MLKEIYTLYKFSGKKQASYFNLRHSQRGMEEYKENIEQKIELGITDIWKIQSDIRSMQISAFMHRLYEPIKRFGWVHETEHPHCGPAFFEYLSQLEDMSKIKCIYTKKDTQLITIDEKRKSCRTEDTYLII
jgi:hypothetical protein